MFSARQGFFASQKQIRTPKVLTCAGSAALSTAQQQFGTASGLVGTSGARLNDIFAAYNSTGIAQLQNINQWTDWTAECWVRYNSLAAPDDGGEPATMGCMERSDFPINWSMGASRTGAMVFAYVVGSTFYTETSTAGIMTTNTWYHLASVKQGTSMKVYVGGVERLSFTLAGTVASAARPFTMGSYYRIGADMYIDEVRVSKAARYTSAFTPPTAAFTNDADTLLLLHLDGTNGSTTIVDDNS